MHCAEHTDAGGLFYFFSQVVYSLSFRTDKETSSDLAQDSQMNASAYPQCPILMVDDEPQTLIGYEMALRSANINHMIRCQESRDVMGILSSQEIEVMMLDLTMPHLSGEEILSIVMMDYPEVPVIIITGANDVETAVRCMKSGAFDYMIKPVEKSRLISGVRRAVELRELQRENRRLRAHVLSDTLEHPEAFSEIITNSPVMRSMFQYIESISMSPHPVLITGETGVGKELTARAIHRLSQRQGGIVPVRVAGLEDHVLSDNLFGHTRGAFPGADEVRIGMVEKASGGTLFLDEIGEMSLELQGKLLGLLQNGEFFPLGSVVAKRSDARIVVSTNQDHQMLQESGRFRKDLYHRLCVHHVQVPPLRERREDLFLLVEHFMEEASKKLGKQIPDLSMELVPLFEAYSFPGNVRELQSLMFDAVRNHKSGKLSMEGFQSYFHQRDPRMESELKLRKVKGKALHLLSHELRTPLAIIQGQVRLLKRKFMPQLSSVDGEQVFEIFEKNLDRLIEIQRETDKIIRSSQESEGSFFLQELDRFWSKLEDISEISPGMKTQWNTLKGWITKYLSGSPVSLEPISLFPFVGRILERIKERASHRDIHFQLEGATDLSVFMDLGILEEILEGLLKNAIENTPDEGMIRILIEENEKRPQLKVQDFGIGITEENLRYIFDGLFPTQETDLYMSKNPFDFNAGGKGLDLLRMKTYGQRFGFDLSAESRCCIYLTTDRDVCPGRISRCPHCKTREDCAASGGSTFSVAFQAVRESTM
jgi:DNA-binding NtrC family response regulator